ncbi:MAG TPA: NYN domain-containing protein [Candidatus Avirikenella pullistercoris]|nr:NYN domain-containing protein [Candidatus Avirikenella pullistercoris]
MQSNKLTSKIGVFYDGNFFLHTSNYYNYIHPQKRRLSINGLHQFIRYKVAEEEGIDVKDCRIVEAHYFRGRLNASDASQRGNQLYNDRVFDDILMSEGVSTHYLPLRNFFGRKEERGIDVWLALEAYELSLFRKLDVVVLVASDTDYVPLVRKLSSIGVKVVLLSWEFEYTSEEGKKVVTKTSHELLNLVSYPIPMHDLIVAGLDKGDELIESLFVNDFKEGGSFEGHKEISEILSLKNGYGFIKYPNNNLFFHYQNVIGDFTELQVGDTVEFVLDKNSEKQDIAKNVRKIDPDILLKSPILEDDFFDWNNE